MMDRIPITHRKYLLFFSNTILKLAFSASGARSQLILLSLERNLRQAISLAIIAGHIQIWPYSHLMLFSYKFPGHPMLLRLLPECARPTYVYPLALHDAVRDHAG